MASLKSEFLEMSGLLKVTREARIDRVIDIKQDKDLVAEDAVAWRWLGNRCVFARR